MLSWMCSGAIIATVFESREDKRFDIKQNQYDKVKDIQAPDK